MLPEFGCEHVDHVVGGLWCLVGVVFWVYAMYRVEEGFALGVGSIEYGFFVELSSFHSAPPFALGCRAAASRAIAPQFRSPLQNRVDNASPIRFIHHMAEAIF